MQSTWPSKAAEVDHLILNAYLRDELEPYLDESVELVDVQNMTTQMENEFLASMLAWEHAPVLPISKWFEPELKLAHPDTLNDDELRDALWKTIGRLCEKRIVLEYTDHLSDRELYCLLYRDILPSHEKKIDPPRSVLRWHCLDIERDFDLWLRYYASEDERERWMDASGSELPQSEEPPFPRKLPCIRS